MEFVALGIVLGIFLIAAFVAFLKAPSRRELPPSGQSPDGNGGESSGAGKPCRFGSGSFDFLLGKTGIQLFALKR